MSAAEGRPDNVRELWPLLGVRDIERSVSFYCEMLGFIEVGRAEDDGSMFWCRLQRGGASLMLQQSNVPAMADAPAPTVVFYFVCDDADVLFEEFTQRGLELERPQEAYYGMRQLFVQEPDGYSICFESPTEAWSG